MSKKSKRRIVDERDQLAVRGKTKPNFFLAALVTPASLFALFAGAIASLVTGTAIPLIGAAAASALYFGLLSTTPSFRRAVRANFEAQIYTEGLGSGDPVGDDLSSSQQQHYESLRGLVADILQRYRRMPGGRVLAASSEAKLNGLLNSFLRLITTLNAYRQFLSTADKKSLENELAQLEVEVQTDTSEALRDVKTRRIEILRKRISRYVQAEESREVVSHQLASIEDMLRLTHEQSIAIRDPQLVGEQLNALSTEVAATEETVRELDSFMQVTDEISSTAGTLPRSGVRER